MVKWAITAGCGMEDDKDCTQEKCIGLTCPLVGVWLYDPIHVDADNNAGLDIFLTNEQVEQLERRLIEDN